MLEVLRDVFFEELTEFDERDIVVNLSVDDVGNGTCLFADDDAYDVDLFADTDGGAVSKSEVGVDLVVRGDGKDASGGEDGVFLNYDGTVVEWGVFEEESFEEGGGGGGVDAFACGDDVVEFVLAFEDNERAGFGLRHVHAGLDVGLYVERRGLRDVVFPEEEAFAEGVAGKGGLGANEEEEFANFGLEDDNQRNQADAYYLAEQGSGKAHVEEIGDLTCDDDDEDGPKDANDVGSSNQAVEVEKECGYQEYVDDVDKADGMETCDEREHFAFCELKVEN